MIPSRPITWHDKANTPLDALVTRYNRCHEKKGEIEELIKISIPQSKARASSAQIKIVCYTAILLASIGWVIGELIVAPALEGSWGQRLAIPTTIAITICALMPVMFKLRQIVSWLLTRRLNAIAKRFASFPAESWMQEGEPAWTQLVAAVRQLPRLDNGSMHFPLATSAIRQYLNTIATQRTQGDDSAQELIGLGAITAAVNISTACKQAEIDATPPEE